MGLEQLVRSSEFSTEVTVLPWNLLKDLLVRTYNQSPLNHDNLVRQLKNATESPEVRQAYLRDMDNIFGRALNKVLDWRGYARKMPDHYTILDLPEQVMAATITANDGTVILAYNRKHADKLMSNRLLGLYVNLHEHGHVRGERSESSTEGLVGDAAYWVRKALQPFYRVSQKARDIVDQAIAVEIYAVEGAQAQYGR